MPFEGVLAGEPLVLIYAGKRVIDMGTIFLQESRCLSKIDEVQGHFRKPVNELILGISKERQEHVVGLDIPVNVPQGVKVLETVEDRCSDLHGLLQIQCLGKLFLLFISSTLAHHSLYDAVVHLIADEYLTGVDKLGAPLEVFFFN